MKYRYLLLVGWHELLKGNNDGQDLIQKAYDMEAKYPELYHQWRAFSSTYGIGIWDPDKISKKRLTICDRQAIITNEDGNVS